MPRKREKASTAGLLPLMEARPRKRGFTYRYHPIGQKPINLGHDRQEALQKVLELTGQTEDTDTMDVLWEQYKKTTNWASLSDNTRTDYMQCSIQLLKVFGRAQPWHIKPKDVARYVRTERADAPVRANREKSLLSNLMNLAVERGLIDENPCKQVRRNPEQPRSEAPPSDVVARFADWVARQTPQRKIIGMMAECTALGGSRGTEFRDLAWPQIDESAKVIRIKRAKQRGEKRGQVIDLIEITPAFQDLIDRLKSVRRERGVDCLYVFPTQENNFYTASGLKSMWNKTRAAKN